MFMWLRIKFQLGGKKKKRDAGSRITRITFIKPTL